MRPPRRFLFHAVVFAGLLLGAGCAASAPAPEAPAGPQATARVRAGLLNLLKCPSVNCDVLEDLHAGQEVTILSPLMNGWVMVRLPSGREGYVKASFLAR